MVGFSSCFLLVLDFSGLDVMNAERQRNECQKRNHGVWLVVDD